MGERITMFESIILPQVLAWMLHFRNELTGIKRIMAGQKHTYTQPFFPLGLGRKSWLKTSNRSLRVIGKLPTFHSTAIYCTDSVVKFIVRHHCKLAGLASFRTTSARQRSRLELFIQASSGSSSNKNVNNFVLDANLCLIWTDIFKNKEKCLQIPRIVPHGCERLISAVKSESGLLCWGGFGGEKEKKKGH